MAFTWVRVVKAASVSEFPPISTSGVFSGLSACVGFSSILIGDIIVGAAGESLLEEYVPIDDCDVSTVGCSATSADMATAACDKTVTGCVFRFPASCDTSPAGCASTSSGGCDETVTFTFYCPPKGPKKKYIKK